MDRDGFFITSSAIPLNPDPNSNYDADTEVITQKDPILLAKQQFWGRGARHAFFQKFKTLDKICLPSDFPVPRPPTPLHPGRVRQKPSVYKEDIKHTDNTEERKKKRQFHRPNTPRSTYLRECRKMHMPPQPMLDYYTRSKRSHINQQTGRVKTASLQSINFNGYGMGNDRALAYAKALQIKTALKTTTFNFSGNGLTETGASALIQAVSDIGTVTDLDLSNNRIGRLGTESLVKYLKTKGKDTLRKLSLKGNRLGDKWAKLARCPFRPIFRAVPKQASLARRVGPGSSISSFDQKAVWCHLR